MADVDDGTGAGNEPDRPVAARVDRDVVGDDVKETGVAGGSGDDEGGIDRPARLIVGVGPVADRLVAADREAEADLAGC